MRERLSGLIRFCTFKEIAKFICLIFSLVLLLAEKDCKTLAEEVNKEIQKNSDIQIQIQLLRNMTEKCPSIPEPFYNLGVIQFERGELNDAFENFRKAYELRKSDKFAVALLVAANKTRNTGAFETVWKSATKAVKKDVLERVRQAEDAQFMRSFYENSLGCEFARLALKAEVPDLFAVASRDCSEEPLRSLYALILARKSGREFKDLLKNISVVDLTGFDTTELYRLFELYVEAEEFELAESLYRRISKTDISPDLRCAGGYVYSKLNKPQQAQALIQGAACQSETCFDLCSRAAYFSGQLQQARVFLEDAIARYPESAHFYNMLGVVHRSLGNRKEAKINFSKAVQLDPNNEDARRNLELN